MNSPTPKPLVVLSSFAPSLYGTERILLAMAEALRPEYDTCILSPPGALQDEAARLGIEGHSFVTKREFAGHVRRLYRGRRELAFFATSVWHTLVISMLNLAFRRRIANFHAVHGGSTEVDSYSRKHKLRPLDVRFVCPSEFVKGKLEAYRVPGSRVDVVPNFLSPSHLEAVTPRAPFAVDGIRNAVVISRIDPIKRIDLLLDALDRHPDLRDLPIRIAGGGALLDELKDRARLHPNVTFLGRVSPGEALREIAAADLMLHFCPEEPFGLVLLEAMASRVPVLAPDSGGPASIIEDGRTGYAFRANDVDSLAAAIRRLRAAKADELNGVVASAQVALETTYSMPRCIDAFRSLIHAHLK